MDNAYNYFAADNYFTAEDDIQRVVYQARMEEREIALTQGKKEGREEGREEEREKHEKTIIETIKAMLLKGADIGFISDVTKKDPEFIAGIRDSM